MSRALAWMVAAVCCGLPAFALRGAGLPPLPEGEDCFTLAVFGDTQKYAVDEDGVVSNPSFASRVGWLADPANIRAQNIVFLCHQGDIVDRCSDPAQWAFASAQMARLDGVLPYAICPGNHDVRKACTQEFTGAFPASRYEGSAWYGGSFSNCTYSGTAYYGNNANSYQLVESGGMRLILFHLQCNAGRPVLDWVNDLLANRYADRKAIIVTHQYLGAVLDEVAGSCKEMAQRKLGRMRWSKVSGVADAMGPCPSWQYCFSRHPNVIMVLCGDQSEALSYRQRSVGLHGNTVHEICMDYPHADDSDWIRLYRFFPKRGRIEAYTYSPQKDALCESAGYCKDVRFHRFDLELDDGAGRIADILVRQQWPWDGAIRVDYTLSAPKGGTWAVTPVVTCAGAEVAVPAAAVSGETDGVTAGRHALAIDAAQLDLGGAASADLTVTLAVAPEAGEDEEVLYRLVSLAGDKAVIDLTRSDIRSGDWGPWMEDPSAYRAWLDGRTAKESLLAERGLFAWTGVTNSMAYRRDWLVLRRIAAGKDFSCTESNIASRLTKDYWIGVFEYTQGQFERVYEVASNLAYSAAVTGGSEEYHRTMWFTNASCSAGRPVDNVSWVDIRGANSAVWPNGTTGVSTAKVIGQIRKVTGLDFDLPTELQWTYAAKALSTTDFCTGYGWWSDSADACMARLGRYRYNGGRTPDDGEPDRDCTAELGTAVVGSYAPNPWGLYDVHGNVREWTLDRGSTVERLQELAEEAGGTLVDSLGEPAGNEGLRMLMNGRYSESKSSSRLSNRSALSYSKRDYAQGAGLRLCLPFAALDEVPGITVSPAVPVAVETRADAVWRTARSFAQELPCFWPEKAYSATLTVTTNGAEALAPQEIARNADDLVTNLVVALPAAVDAQSECVVDLRLVLKDTRGRAVETRTARLGVVRGVGTDAAEAPVRDPSRRAAWKRTGASAVLPVAAGVSSVTIDGTAFGTGLDGAAGWFWWTPIGEGVHTLGCGGFEARVRCGVPGALLLLR